MNVFFLLCALLGHAFLWVGLVNRLHALGIRRRIIKVITLGFFACAALIPIAVAWHCLRQPTANTGPDVFVDSYVLACWLAVVVTLVRLVYLRVIRRPPSILRFHGRQLAQIDLASAATNAAELGHHFLTRLPLNEIVSWQLRARVTCAKTRRKTRST